MFDIKKDSNKGKRIKTKIGKVVADKMDQSIIVLIERVITHKLYQKKFARSNKITAHDPKNVYRIGDMVEICETRPISKTKSWKVVKKIESKETK